MLGNGNILNADGRQYTVIETLGRGANTTAYLAECQDGNLISKCILKEYSPQNHADDNEGKARFIASGKMQNAIRQRSVLTNQTPPVSHIFEANGTAYIDVACYNGTTLDKLTDLKLPQYMSICRTIANTVGYYHKSGYLCLDLKPENIFVMQNSPDDTITQLVEFIDFDSVRDMQNGGNTVFSYTRSWAAPEQLDLFSAARISTSAVIFTVGEIVFYMLFGRHSNETEHRGFSKYPFDECKHEYRKYTERPDVQAIYTNIFRGTLRSSASNRFRDICELTRLLDELVDILNQKDYIVPILPSVSPDFVGRDMEMRHISESLRRNNVLYITGIGGIGKSTLLKNYILRYKTEYDIITYLEYDGDMLHTFCDDMQLQISTVYRGNEPLDIYFSRKFKAFKRICGEKKVLFVLDNFSGRVTKDMSRIIDCGYDIIIATRNQPPKNSFPYIEITAISDISDIFRLITLNLERPLTKDERACFEEIITLVQGHTLVIELIARQIAAGRLNIHTTLDLIRKNGFSRFSGEKIGNYKDGEEVYDTLSSIISVLFDAGNMTDSERLAMKILSLLNVRGLETDLVRKFFPDIQDDDISKLSAEGWIYADNRIHIHPVISETVQHWNWVTDDISVMEYHKKAIDIYVGMSNHVHIRNIIREAEIYKAYHERHIVRGMYFDMLGCYYDTLLGGAYFTETDEEADILEDLIENMGYAISEMQLSGDKRREKYLPQFCLSMAAVLLRAAPDAENYAEVSELLDIAQEFIEENGENHCYYCMVSAWYFTLAEPDIDEMRTYTEQAEGIAKEVFKTDLEIIDIIHIPTANCYFYLGEPEISAEKLMQALDICMKYPDSLPYIDKRAELLNCLLDIYSETGDLPKCRELIAQIDHINETYKEQGIHREISPEIREKAGS